MQNGTVPVLHAGTVLVPSMVPGQYRNGTPMFAGTLYTHFVDFQRAFDSVHRESLWRIMEWYGIPNKLVDVVKALYQDFQCAVIDDKQRTEWFRVETGVKQGCNMSGFLFLMVIDWIMTRTTQERAGIRWKFTTVLEDLDFADDIALLSSRKRDLQSKTDKLTAEAKRIGLNLNPEKCKGMSFNSQAEEELTIEEKAVEEVDKFEYLGATVSKQGGGTEDINNRINKARCTFKKLNKVWSAGNIRRRTKVRLYNALVKTVLLYGCETWKMNKGDEKKLNTFQYRCLRRILNIKWQDKITNKEVQERTQARDISLEVKKRRWKFIGHVLRGDPNSDAKTAMTWQPEGKRKQGRPKTTWRRTVEAERNKAGWNSWSRVTTVAKDRVEWRKCVEALCAERLEEDR